MSYNLTDAKSKLALDVALTSKIEVYGMLYDTDWWEMFNRQMIINALELDDAYTSSGENLAVNSDFLRWIGGNPWGWTVTESPPNSEITEVGSTEGYGGTGTGSCNIYLVSGSCYMKRDILTLGNLFTIKFDVTKVVTGELYVRMGNAGNITTGINEEKTYYFTKICDGTTGDFIIGASAPPTDITIDNLYVYDYPHPFPFLSTTQREKLEDRLTVLSNK